MHITIYDIVPSLAMLENCLWLNRPLVSWMRHYSNSTKTYEAVFLYSFSDSFLYCVTSFSHYSRSQGTLNSSFYVVPTCTCFNYSNLIAHCVWCQLVFTLPKQPSVPSDQTIWQEKWNGEEGHGSEQETSRHKTFVRAHHLYMNAIWM